MGNLFIKTREVEALTGISFSRAKESLANAFISLEIKELLVQKVILNMEEDQEIKDFLSSGKEKISPFMRKSLLKKIVSFSVKEILEFGEEGEDIDAAYISIETMNEIPYNDRVRLVLANLTYENLEGFRSGVAKRIFEKDVVELGGILKDKDIPLRYRQEIALNSDYSDLSPEDFQQFADNVEAVDFDVLQLVDKNKYQKQSA